MASSTGVIDWEALGKTTNLGEVIRFLPPEMIIRELGPEKLLEELQKQMSMEQIQEILRRRQQEK